MASLADSAKLLTKQALSDRLDSARVLRYRSGIDASTNPNYPAAISGDQYRITTAGLIGGAAGEAVEPGDTITCHTDTAEGDHATVGANWDIGQANIDGAVIGPASAGDGNLPMLVGTSGREIGDSGLDSKALASKLPAIIAIAAGAEAAAEPVSPSQGEVYLVTAGWGAFSTGDTVHYNGSAFQKASPANAASSLAMYQGFLSLGNVYGANRAGERRVYVGHDDASTDNTIGHACLETRLDYAPATDPSGMQLKGLYGVIWYNAPRTFTGLGTALRGNVYTIAQTADAAVNVDFMTGAYGRSRHQAAGTVANAIGLYADHVHNVGSGNVAKAIGVYIRTTSNGGVGDRNFGIWFDGSEPSDGSIAANDNIYLSLVTYGASRTQITGKGAGGVGDGTRGDLQIGPYAQAGSDNGGGAWFGSSVYRDRSVGGFKHAVTGFEGSGVYCIGRTVEIHHFASGTIDTAIGNGTHAKFSVASGNDETHLELIVRKGAAAGVLERIGLGAADSGGTGLRALVVTN